MEITTAAVLTEKFSDTKNLLCNAGLVDSDGNTRIDLNGGRPVTPEKKRQKKRASIVAATGDSSSSTEGSTSNSVSFNSNEEFCIQAIDYGDMLHRATLGHREVPTMAELQKKLPLMADNAQARGPAFELSMIRLAFAASPIAAKRSA